MKKNVVLILLMIILFGVISSVTMATSTGIVTTETVRLRREANTSSDILELIGEGTEVEILGEEDGWYQVKYDGLTGYVSSKYIKLTSTSSSEDGTTNTAVPAGNTSSELPDGVEVVVNETNNTSNTSNDSITTNNDELDNTDTNFDNTIINETTISNDNSTEFNLSKDAEIRIIPSFSSNKINTISEGTKVTVIDTLNKWVKITDGTNSGWVVRQNVDGTVTTTGNADIKETEDNNPDVTVSVVDNGKFPTQTSGAEVVNSKGIVNTDGARLRSSADGKVYTLLDINSELEIIGEEDSWYIVNIGEYTNAYISKSLVDKN